MNRAGLAGDTFKKMYTFGNEAALERLPCVLWERPRDGEKRSGDRTTAKSVTGRCEHGRVQQLDGATGDTQETERDHGWQGPSKRG